MANLRFAVSMQSKSPLSEIEHSAKFKAGLVPFLGYHHVLMILIFASIILTSVLLAGCSSYSTMTSIYPLALSYVNTTNDVNMLPIDRNLSATLASFKASSVLEVRTGYFGICVKQAGVLWICGNNGQALRDQIGPENDPLNLIQLGIHVMDQVLFPGLLLMAIVLSFCSACLLGTFPGWHEEHDATTGSDVDVKPFPSRSVSQSALALVFVAAVLSLMNALWQHIGAVAAASVAERTGYGNIKASIGATAMVFGWLGFFLWILVTIGLLVMILSIMVLDRLTDDD